MEPLEVEPKKADMAPLEVESKKADMAPLEVGSKKAIAESMPPPPVPVKKSASLTLGSVTISFACESTSWYAREVCQVGPC